MTNLEQLAQIIAAHTRAPIRCYPPKCLCGETVETTQANHQAQAIIDAGWTPPVKVKA